MKRNFTTKFSRFYKMFSKQLSLKNIKKQSPIDLYENTFIDKSPPEVASILICL